MSFFRNLIPLLFFYDDGWSLVWLWLMLSYYDRRHQMNQERQRPLTLSTLTPQDGGFVWHFGWYLS